MGNFKQIGNEKVSELRMAMITNASFIMCYRKSEDNVTSAKTKTPGAIRLGEIESLDQSSLKYAAEVPINLQCGFGFKRGIPIRLGNEKYAIAYEITDVDSVGNWKGSAGLAIGTIGGGGDHR